jgi:hypothetical protein
MKKFLGCVVASLGVAASASAQSGANDVADDSWYDGSEAYGGAGGDWLEAGPTSASSGGTVTLGQGGSLGPRAVPERYRIRRGDTLWDITGRFYGSPWQWPRVWSYNPEVTNPHWIYPGDTLRLKDTDGDPEPLPGTDIDVATVDDRPRTVQGSVYLGDQGYLDEDALAQAATIVGSPEEQMLLSPYDEVYLQLDDEASAREGQELTVFREYNDNARVGGDRLPSEKGTLVRILGTVKVRTYDPDRGVARGVITEALDPIERGFRVADMARRFHMVPPRTNQMSLVTEVVATLRPRELLADQQVIFVPVGADSGVEAGNRFFVVGRGDTWRQSITTSEATMGAAEPRADELDEYPPEVLAEARVVDVRPNSSTLLITRSIREVEIGDRVEMRKGF